MYDAGCESAVPQRRKQWGDFVIDPTFVTATVGSIDRLIAGAVPRNDLRLLKRILVIHVLRRQPA